VKSGFKFKTLRFGVVAVGMLALTGICQAASVATGASWEVTRNNGASYITPPTTITARTLPDGTSATGIFEGNPSNSADTWYREFFELTAATQSAKAHFRTDDLFQLLVNGFAVPGVADDVGVVKDASPVAGLDIPAAFFVIGTNEVLFKTQTYGDGDPHLAARLDITAVPEPGSAMLIGLAGLALLARRRGRCPRLARAA
jgi:hypothetical protein